MVKAVPRLKHDVDAILKLMEPEKPPLKRVRAKATGKVYDGFGDASGCGFGTTIQIRDGIIVKYGQWTQEVTKKSSSNWRELNNLLEMLKHVVVEHDLVGSDIFYICRQFYGQSRFLEGNLEVKETV
jgi:hypothetical protein